MNGVFIPTTCSNSDENCMSNKCQAYGLTFLKNNHFSEKDGTTYALCGKTHITNKYSNKDPICGGDRNNCIQKECKEHGLSMSGWKFASWGDFDHVVGLCTPAGYEIPKQTAGFNSSGPHPCVPVPMDK